VSRYVLQREGVFAALLVPFLLLGLFTKGAMGVHVDEMYSGGPTVRTVSPANIPTHAAERKAVRTT
jgi:hypothetical protein